MNWLTRSNELPSLFSQFFENSDLFGNHLVNRDFVPAVNVKETENHYVIDVAAPGLTAEDLKIELNDGMLTVMAEKKKDEQEKGDRFMRREFSYSTFRRSFTLPENVDVEHIKANYDEGILSVWMDKREITRPEGRKIPIS